MPRQAKAGHRKRIEAALGKERSALLAEICERLGLPLARWQAVAPVQAIFETLAIELLAERIQVERGLSYSKAVRAAAEDLGIPEKTHATRMDRWYRKAYRRQSS